jgi:hypothetical protein
LFCLYLRLNAQDAWRLQDSYSSMKTSAVSCQNSPVRGLFQVEMIIQFSSQSKTKPLIADLDCCSSCESSKLSSEKSTGNENDEDKED